MTARRLAYIALFTAIALVMHVLESALPPLLPFAPGAKMGLANVVSLIALFVLGAPDAYAVLIARCLLGSMFGGNVWSLSYALPAGIASLAVETVLVKTAFPRVSLTTVGFAGALMHNAVQLAVASLQVGTNLIAMLPAFLLASLIAGLFTGATAYYTLKFLPEKYYLLGGQNDRKGDKRQ